MTSRIAGVSARATTIVLAMLGGTVLLASGILWKPSEAPELVEADSEMKASSSEQGEVAQAQVRDRTQTEGRVPTRGRLRAIDEVGAPITNALLSWTSLSNTWLTDGQLSAATDKIEIKQATEYFTSDSDGYFSLPPGMSAGEHGAVIWITHHRFVAEPILVDGARPTVYPTEVQLVGCEPILGVVIDEADQQIVGATVRQTLEGIDTESRVFVREHTTGDGGQCFLFPTPNQQRIEAWQGPLQSGVYLRHNPSEVQIRLFSYFLGRGEVSASSDSVSMENLQVFCSRTTGNRRLTLGRYPVRPDGTWGPFRIPIMPGGEYDFDLEGDHVLRKTVTRPTPAPREQVVVAFRAEPGITLSALVVDDAGNPIQGADVQAVWRQDENWQYSGSIANAKGHTVIRSCPPDRSYHFIVSADGFIGRTVGPYGATDEIVRIVLERAGTLRGTVKRDGRPAKAFSVSVWREPSASVTTERFESPSKGLFTLAVAPVGRVFVTAHADGSPPGTPKEVFVDPESGGDVELELTEALVARGTVVNVLTRASVAGAKLQRHTSSATLNSLLDPWGSPVACRVDGTFELPGFVIGTNGLQVEAEGYEPSYLVVQVDDENDLDLGEIVLNPRRALTVRLEVPGVEDLTSYAAEITQYSYVSDHVLFDDAGITRFDELLPGNIIVRIITPEGIGMDDSVHLDARETEWLVDVRLPDPDHSEGVNVVLEGEVPEGPVYLKSSFLTKEGMVRRRSQAFRGNPALVEGPFASDLVVEVIDSAFQTIKVRHVSKSELQRGVVHVQLDGDPRRFRIVDRDRQPLATTLVHIRIREGSGFWQGELYSDSAGEFAYPIPSEGTTLISLYHRMAGSVLDLPLEVSEENVTEIVLDSTAYLRLRAMDGRDPVSGVAFSIFRESGESIPILFTAATTSDGRTFQGPLSRGPYLVRPMAPSIWPAVYRVETTESDDAQDLQVRRVGDLIVRFVDSKGAPASGASIELVSDELGGRASEWLGAGLIGGPDDLSPDSSGILHLTGLPRGTYKWTIESDPRKLEGTCRVTAGQEELLTVEL